MGEPKSRIQPRTLKGFCDYLPDVALARERMMETARGVFRSFGFAPIDTPALEYEEILAGKGGEESDKQMFRFEDQGGRRVAMRFDLTVPLARFAAQYLGELGTPFKRYHIGAVWRGEKPQRGRYREFVQCDFDTLGTESIGADAETVLVIHDLLRALGYEDFVVRVNNRRVLNGILERLGLAERAAAVLRALDKLDKLGPQGVAREMVAAAGIEESQAREVLRLGEISASAASDEEALRRTEPLVCGSALGERGLAELRELAGAVRAAGAGAQTFQVDLSIARGLDYYTGTVYETFLGALPEIGSVCSGGRYDDLAELFTNQRLPGVGASLGLDRLLAAMQELGRLERRATPAEVLIPWFAEGRWHDYLRLAARLRRAGIAVEVYPEPRKLGAQLKYADRRGHRLALILGEDEWQRGQCQIKDLRDQTTGTCPLEGIEGAVQAALERALAR